MLSPFPGMDPFIEAPARWGGMHSRLINSISDYLADRVSPDFFVEIEERVYIVQPDDPGRRPIVPDVHIINGTWERDATATVGVITAPTLVEPIYETEIRDRYIEIYDREGHEIVTTLEVLSPFNKASGSRGHQAFMKKRHMVTSSRVHWIEIDLLRAGQRPPEVAGKSDYYALLKRGTTSGPFEVWYIDLRDKLPTIAVPLRPPYEDAALDLQAVFEQVYVRAHYAESVAYEGEVPPPPLAPADQIWVQARLRAWKGPSL